MNRIWWKFSLLIIFVLQSLTFGQWISPGKLSASHSSLEGINNCTLCHNIGEKITEEKCLACHSKVKLQLEEQSGYHFLNKDQSCTECHHEHRGVEHSLRIIDEKTFDHSKLGFALEGEHKKLECTECHKIPGTYSGLDKNCLSCHDDLYHGRLEKDCSKCHSFETFKPSIFKHKETDFGATHESVECASCHINGQYKNLETNCLSCHKDEHKGQLTYNCKECHKTTSFTDLKFEHDKQASFKLEKQHLDVTCTECHQNKIYERESTDCNVCHVDEHKGQLDQDCSKCHTVDGFETVTFEHKEPYYALEGSHKTLLCESCHITDNFKDTPKTCVDCHEDEHKGELDQKCEPCHTFDQFDKTTFKHEKPNYELTGAHTELLCTTCHEGKQFKPLDQSCASCHDEEHKGEFAQNCDECHTTENFKPAKYKHKETDFQALGKHKETSCNECHNTGLYKPVSDECTTCHTDVHQTSLGNDCTQCHGYDTWQQVAYDHNISDYILKGRHLDLMCEECHQQGVFEGTRTECFSCHLDPHQHKFGQDCESCHTEDNWVLLQYNHDFSGYPLQGVHSQLECASCHPMDQIVGTPQNCYGCHRMDFEAAIEPNHQAAKFSVECEECHKNTDISWEFGYWLEHESVFPLRSSSAGHHSNFTCSECHPTPNNYRKFNCLSCHPRDEMDTAHRDTRQYKYQNNKCFKCHPMGEIEEVLGDH